MSRLAPPTAIAFHSVEPPFSNFQFVDDHFGGGVAIRRLFSLARAQSREFKTLVVEDIPAAGVVADENAELAKLYSDYQFGGLKRISFWRPKIADEAALAAVDAKECVGWAIVKRDQATIPHRPAVGRSPDRPAKKIDRWHVFESVTIKYGHHHNYAPGAPAFPVQIGHRDAPLTLRGWLFCQQNVLNKCCAHVAIRTLATAFLNNPDLPFSRINSLIPASSDHLPDWLPGDGLFPPQIEAVLKQLSIPFDSVYYPERPEREDARRKRPFQRYLYSGVEAGAGAMLAFTLDGPKASGGHIIPVFGHTFNEDTWAPRGEGAYFRVGERITYIPSESWTSSFLAHDDNFGSDFCLPKRCIKRRHASYVVALRPEGYAYGGIDAEAVGSQLFYSLPLGLFHTGNCWLKRLVHFVRSQELILRTVPISKTDYEKELRAMCDWERKTEKSDTVDTLVSLMREKMWMVEVSVPDLFSTNLRKLGELLLTAETPLSPTTPHQAFVVARFPGNYVLLTGQDAGGQPQFSTVPSAIGSHTKLFRA